MLPSFQYAPTLLNAINGYANTPMPTLTGTGTAGDAIELIESTATAVGNGSFATYNGGYGYGTIDGWNTVSGSIGTNDGTQFGVFWDNGYVPTEAAQVAFLQIQQGNDATISQLVDLEPGQQYLLTYYEGRRLYGDDAYVSVTLGGQTVIGSHAAVAVGSNNPFRLVTATFTATASQEDLQFSASNPGAYDATALIADVSVIAKQTLGTATVAADGSWQLATIPILQGQHSVFAIDTDPSDGSTSYSATANFVLDSIAPDAPTLTTVSPLFSSSAIPTIYGHAEALSGITLLDGANPIATTTADASGGWSFTATSPLSFGHHSLTVTSTDAAGNVSANSLPMDFTVTLPALPIIPIQTTPTPNPVIAIVPTIDPTIPVAPTNDPEIVIAPSVDPDVAPQSTTPRIADPSVGTSIFRFFDLSNGTQFLTSSVTERDGLMTSPNFHYEGVGLQSAMPDASDTNTALVYRFFDTGSGNHFYTISSTEAGQVIATRPDLVLETSDFYEHLQAVPGDVAVYRFFNSQTGSHLFSSSADERASIAATRPDLVNEGVAFYSPNAT